MNTKKYKKIFKRLNERHLRFKHVCEVGVYLPETSNVINFIQTGSRATLVEADPVIIKKIKEFFANYDVSVVNVAIWETNGTVKLSKAAASTFVTDLESSPAIINDSYEFSEENTFEVRSQIFSEIDDGTIDLLSIDIEGSEWFVIKNLVSRPKVISVETHGKYYCNPHLKEILSWMERNNYKIWYKDSSDTVFVQNEFLKPSLIDTIQAHLVEVKLNWKRCKRRFQLEMKRYGT